MPNANKYDLLFLSNINLCEVASLFFISTNLYKRQDSTYACVTRGTGSGCGRRLY